jgi:hypothetical protein
MAGAAAVIPGAAIPAEATLIVAAAVIRARTFGPRVALRANTSSAATPARTEPMSRPIIKRTPTQRRTITFQPRATWILTPEGPERSRVTSPRQYPFRPQSGGALKVGAILAVVCSLGACGPSTSNASSGGSASPSVIPLPGVDSAVWREVEPGNLAASMAFMCAGALDELGRSDPTLADHAVLQVPWSVQVTRKGKLQAQCVWTGPARRTGRIVVDVLCKNDDDEHCSRFAYGVEGDHHIGNGPHVKAAPPPTSSSYPPGRDKVEQDRSIEIIGWARDHAADHLGALRSEIRNPRVGISSHAKVPFLCLEAREGGGTWHKLAVYSLGPSGSETFHWADGKDRDDFCNTVDEDLQWYAVPAARLNG